MHFNDLLIRLRTQSIGGVAALAALATIISRGDITPGMRWGILVSAFFFLTLFWVAIWILDFKYYNRLLLGAVSAIIEVEAISKNGAPCDGLTLSTRIEAVVANITAGLPVKQPLKGYSGFGRWWFYVIVLCALLSGLLVSTAGLAGLDVTFQSIRKPGVAGVIKNALTKAPLQGAEVKIDFQNQTSQPSSAVTASDGRFVVSPQRRWGIYWFPRDSVPVPLTFRVERPGFQAWVFEFAHSEFGDIRMTNFGDILLQVSSK